MTITPSIYVLKVLLVVLSVFDVIPGTSKTLQPDKHSDRTQTVLVTPFTTLLYKVTLTL